MINSSVKPGLLLNAVFAELEPVIAGLAMLDSVTIEDWAKRKAGAEIDNDAINSLLNQLRELLDEDNYDAVDALSDLLPLLSGQGMDATLNKITAAMDKYDFEVALDTIPLLEAGVKLKG